MGKASISIAVTGSYNGSALEKAEKRLDSMSKKVASTSTAMEGANAKLVTSGAKIATVGGDIYNTGAKIEAAGQKTMGVTAAAVGIGVATGTAAVQIDTALTGVRKTVDGTEEQYDQLKEAAIEFSKTNAVSADQILDIQALGAQLGFTIDELDEFSQVVSGLDIATDMDANTAATEMAQFANITKMSHDEVSNYGSAIVNLGNHMATTESSISSMAQRVAAASTQVNMSQADILGWSAAMSSLGIEAEAGGTAFSNTISTIDAAVATGSDKVQTFAEIAGMSAEEFSASWKNSASDTLMALLEGTDGAENMTVTLEEMGVTGIRQSDVLKRLAGNTDLVTQALQYSNDGWRENTALQAEVDNRNESMAAKLEILKNKVTAIAEDVGTPLVTALTDAIDAADPLIEAVEQGSTAFSNMDEGSQRAAIGLGVAAAAAGPFLTVTGKLVKGAGNVVTAFGKVPQTIGVYADALTTTDASALKAYSSNQKLSRALESNPAAKAAGGVQQYISAVENAAKDTSAYESAAKRLTKEQQKGSKANEELVQSLTQEVAEKKAAAESSQSMVNGYKQEATSATASTAATTAHAAGLSALTVAANAAKLALAIIAPMAIITGITMLASAFMGAKERADTLSEATDGLIAASAGATNEVENEASAFGAFTGAANDAKGKVDEVLESQAQLAGTIRDTNTTAASQTAQLNDAYATIQQYANQTDLSTEAQGRLRSAVETVNSLCGTQIEVTDAANGRLSDENGAIQDVTASLQDYVTKKLEQIKADAQQSNLSALYQQQAEDIEALAAAQKDYNSKLQDHDSFVESYKAAAGLCSYANDEMAESAYQAYLKQLEQSTGLSDAKSALESVNTSIDNVSASLGASMAAADGAYASVANLALANSTVASAIQGCDKDLTAFSQSLSNAGVSVETFKSLNDDQLMQLVTSWDGSSQSIIDTLASMGVQMGDAGLNATTALSNGMASGSVNVDSATAILKAAASGDWSDVATKMADAGITIPESVASGISSGTYQPSAETSAMLSMVALQLTGGDVTAAAELLGHDIDEGLANGIMNGTLSEGQSAQLGQDVIDRAKETLQSHSPSQAFAQIGSDVDAGLEQGISGNTEGPLSAIGQLGQSLIEKLSGLPASLTGKGSDSSNGLAFGLLSGAGNVLAQALGLSSNAATGVSGTPGSLSATGTSAGAGFAAGIGSGSGSTSSNALGLASSAASGVSGAPGFLGSTGASAGQRFASGVGSARGSAQGSGQGLANAASSGAQNYGNPYSWGSHLGNQFASGIGSAWGAVRSYASSLVSAAKSVMGFSVPEEGPWSGAEKGGVTSGQHLAENFAEGMEKGRAAVREAALGLSEDAAMSGRYATSGEAYAAEEAAGVVPQQEAAPDMTRMLELLESLLSEVEAFREGIGGEIAANAPAFPSERELARQVRSYV